MGIFEDMIVKAKSAVEVVGDKASNFVDVSKLNINIAEENNALKKKYECLGKFIYESEKNGNSDKISIQHYIDEIDGIKSKIDKMKKEVSALKKQTICSKCGKENSSEAKFCSNCGDELAIKCEVNKKEGYEDKQSFDSEID